MIANFSQVAEVLCDVPDAIVLFAGLLGREMGAKSVVLSGDESVYITNKLRLSAKQSSKTPPLCKKLEQQVPTH